MYSYITGDLVEKNPNCVVVDNMGIGYEIMISQNTFNELPGLDEYVKLFTIFQPKENEFCLYGFSTREELETFMLLNKVNGVGPKGAFAILDILTIDDLRFAILSGDHKSIQAASGIGQKTAQKVILELKDKIDFAYTIDTSLNRGAAKNSKQSSANTKNEVIAALTEMGYTAKDVAKAIDMLTISDDISVEELLKLTLKQLSFL